MDDIPLGVLLGTLAGLLVLSGFFSISETSMMALNRYRLKHLAQSGHRGAKLTSALLAQTDKLLGVILLGNNLINAASATLVTVITVRLMGESELALSIATLAVTFVILVFSEITPKVMGAAYPERIALPLSFILAPLLKLFYPVVWFVNLFVRGLLKILRLKPGTENNASLSQEELRTLVLEEAHFIPHKHHSILVNLFELESITVNDVMTPRNQIEAIDLEAAEDEIHHQLSTCHHTRIPVFQGQLDNIVGQIHIRKIFHQMQLDGLGADAVREVMRDPYFIPAGTSLFTQLQNFQENQRRLGLVVDEYGELLGLVSLEDILEEIVGEFTTHAPTQGTAFHLQEDGSWVVDGGSLLRDLNRKLGLAFPLNGPKTLNGLILEHLENIPEAGISLKVAGMTMEILQTQDRAIKTVKIFAIAP